MAISARGRRARLPNPGADDGAWGTLLNEYLLVEHGPDGTHNDGVINAQTCGAVGDGITDDTAAIQAALDAAAPIGGVVWLPPVSGAYRCNGALTIPGHVTLRGGYGGMRRGLQLWSDAPRGSLLHVYGTGDFITMRHNSVLDGVEIHYPQQRTSGTPRPYGWTIRIPADQHGVSVRNICAPNPYQFLYANADGFLVDSVQAFPLAMGMQLDRVADVPRLNNIHFNPNMWSAAQDSLLDWVSRNGVATRMTGVDEFMVTNWFAFGYLRGFWFDALATDPGYPGSYGSITSFGIDAVQEGIYIGDRGIANRHGLSLANGRIIPFTGTPGARTGIKCADTNPLNGPAISATNINFFGEHERSVWIEPNSRARLTLQGGQATEYQNEMVLCQSRAARVRLFGVRSFRGNGRRVNNPGGADVDDVAPMAD